jgi:alpha-beta hydrolase superfamily lysophospholipase
MNDLFQLTWARLRAPALALAVGVALVACASGGGPAAARAPATATSSDEAPKTVKAIEGVLVTYRSGVEIGRERFTDDGERLVSHLTMGGIDATVTLARNPRHVTVESRGRKVEADVDDHTIVLENGAWQPYAIAAAWFPEATTPAPVTVLVPGQGARVEGTITVTPSSSGGRVVKVDVKGLEVTADVDASGLVTRAQVPLQGIEALPEGQAAPSFPDRPAPAGVAAEPFETTGAVPLRGELWRPASATGKVPVVVFIAGSGPTDRDGNSAVGLKTDAYRKVAEALAARGIASMRYDKRGVGKSGVAFDPAQLTLGDYVADAGVVVAQARADARLGPVVLLGHSEGGLIALLLAHKTPLDGLALVATAGRPLALVVREQLGRQLDAHGMAELDRVLAALRSGAPVDPVLPPLDRLFTPATRGLLRSEMDVDPVPLLRALKVPTAIIQGDSDAQVTVADARLLAAARPDAKLTIVTRMSHMLRDEASASLPQASYSDPTLPLSPGLVDALVAAVQAAGQK